VFIIWERDVPEVKTTARDQEKNVLQCIRGGDRNRFLLDGDGVSRGQLKTEGSSKASLRKRLKKKKKIRGSGEKKGEKREDVWGGMVGRNTEDRQTSLLEKVEKKQKPERGTPRVGGWTNY